MRGMPGIRNIIGIGKTYAFTAYKKIESAIQIADSILTITQLLI